MKWLELCIDTARDGLDKLEAMLSALGIDGIEIEDEADFQSFLAGNRKYWDYVDEDLLAQKKGICFDYAALMTAMLRSQDIPTKLVVGYTGNLYHAWINVYLEGQGWVDNIIYFDGNSWKLMDPTFASSSGQSQEIMQYIGNGSNYRAKYSY